MMYGWGNDFSGMWVMMIAMLVFFLLVFGLIAVLMVTATRRASGPVATQVPAAENRAVAILDERLARGEISPVEYREVRATLLGDPKA